MFVSPTPVPDQIRRQAAERLQKLVSSGYVLFLVAHEAHLNVEGPLFSVLHELFKKVYEAALELVDKLSERVATLGGRARVTSILSGQLAVDSPESWDGLALCAHVQKALIRYVAVLDESFRALDALGLTADANVLQNAVTAMEFLGFQIGKHVVVASPAASTRAEDRRAS